MGTQPCQKLPVVGANPCCLPKPDLAASLSLFGDKLQFQLHALKVAKYVTCCTHSSGGKTCRCHAAHSLFTNSQVLHVVPAMMLSQELKYSWCGAGVWSLLHAAWPQIVGGCRQQDLVPYLDTKWNILSVQTVPGGVLRSQVIIACKVDNTKS